MALSIRRSTLGSCHHHFAPIRHLSFTCLLDSFSLPKNSPFLLSTAHLSQRNSSENNIFQPIPSPPHRHDLTCFLRTSARRTSSRRRRCSSKALGCPISSYLRRDLSVSLFVFYLVPSHRIISSYLIGFIYPSNSLSIYLSIYLSFYLQYLVGGQAGMNLSLCPFANSKQCRYANIDNSKGRHPTRITRTTPKSSKITGNQKLQERGCQSPPPSVSQASES